MTYCEVLYKIEINVEGCRKVENLHLKKDNGGIEMKRMKRLVTWLTVLCLALSMSLTAFTTSDATPDVATAREGVLQINLVYEDQSGTQYVLQNGSGFLIGAADGAKTVITNYHVVSLADEDRDTWSEYFGVDFWNTNNITLRIYVVVKRDVMIEASYVNGSEQTDFAILELSQAIYDRTPLKLADSDEVVETQNVYALGFPWVTSEVQDDQVYTSDDVTITNGIVGKFQTISNINYILHNAALGHGNSGGPLVDSNGNVIGVNTLYSDADSASNYYYSISINEIREVLDALGIVYETAGSTTTSTVTTEEPTDDDDTVVVEEPVVTEEPTTPATTEVVEPELEEEESSGPNMLLIGGIIAVVVIIIVVIIIVVTSSGKKKKREAAARQAQMQSQMPNRPPVQPAPQQQRPQSAPVPPQPPHGMTMDASAGETSVLGSGAGETSVLSSNMQPAATLIRRKNGETADIRKASFAIGRERQKVDFCVPDNNSVGRTHANIICKGGVYYIVDNNSTNFTYVNGNKIGPNQEVKLNSGDKIKLADEEFEFRM